MSNIVIRRALEEEAAACLALMPEARGLSAEFLVAHIDSVFAGGAAIAWRNWSDPSGFPISIHVMPRARHQGVGRRLVAAAAELCLGETSGLWSFRQTSDGEPASLFMLACGFQPRRRDHKFEAEVDRLLEYVRPVLDRLKSRPRFPTYIKVIPVQEAPIQEISWLVSSEFGGAPVHVLHRLQERRFGDSDDASDRSIALMNGDHVAGVMLWRIVDNVAIVEARVVSPRNRNSWTNLGLLEASLTIAKSAGVKKFRFNCEDTVRDTLSLARRCDAEETSVTSLYYYTIAAA